MSVQFPGPNDGAYPLDPASEVGKFRVLIGDTAAEKYTPDEPGRANYTMFSDDEVVGFVAIAEGNLNRAVGNAYLALAGRAALESKQIKDFDLVVDVTKRPDSLRQIAYEWFARADKDDAGSQDALFITPANDDCTPIPEGMMPRWGRYAVGKWNC